MKGSRRPTARWLSASAALGAAALLVMSGTAARDARTGAGLPLVVVQTLNQLAVIDPETNRIVRRVHLGAIFIG